ncbi:MAG TPA: acetolactate synthase small subunit [Blastocatellia bacterium]|nr:acetolactate synthase small subunit [Blastocatellia bacterium]
MRHTLSILVENRFGELSRIVGLFSARGFNIESLSVAESMEPDVSRVTLVTTGNEHAIEQIARQLDKQVRVLVVEQVTEVKHVERELMLIKLRADSGEQRHKALSLALLFGARAVDLSADGLIIEATGEWEQVNALGEMLKPLGVVEIVRSGRVAMSKVSRESSESGGQ